MYRCADRHTEQSFAHRSPYCIFRSAAVGHDLCECRRAQFGEPGIARRFDTRQALQQSMQEFRVIAGARCNLF